MGRDEIEHDRSLNDDFVVLQLDAALSVGEAPQQNLVIEGDRRPGDLSRTGVPMEFFVFNRRARRDPNLNRFGRALCGSTLPLKPGRPWP